MASKLLTERQLAHHDIETLKQFVRHHLGGYRVVLRDIKADQPVYRGVTWRERPTVVDQLGCPPSKKVTHWGRAHRPGRPVFYASAASAACFYETKAQPGDHVALSEWVVTKPFWMHNLGYHEEALLRLGVKNLDPRALLAHPIEGESKENAQLRRKLSLSFTDEIPDGAEWNYRYKRPVAVFEQFFDKAEPLDLIPGGVTLRRAGGMVYPAMRLHGMADNLAIFPEFVAEALALRRVLWVLVESHDPNCSAYSLLIESQATGFAGGSIQWEELGGPASDRRTQVALEGDNWVMRDGRREVYFTS